LDAGDDHFYQVMRYVERNPLRIRLFAIASFNPKALGCSANSTPKAFYNIALGRRLGGAPRGNGRHLTQRTLKGFPNNPLFIWETPCGVWFEIDRAPRVR
jgi:hypothetical protein